MFKAEVSPAMPSIGATEDLSLRVSTAVLTKTTFGHPDTGEPMLVLERKAVVELRPGADAMETLQSQPLGGGSRLVDPAALLKVIGTFNYDSAESQADGDFRIQIRPDDWPRVRDFCVRHFMNPSTGVVEANPQREIAEELSDALGIEVADTAYTSRNLGIVIPGASASTRAGVSGQTTVRAFNVYHIEITAAELIAKILENSQAVSNESLLADARGKAASSGTKGKSSGLVALPLKDVISAFQTVMPDEEWKSTTVSGHKIASSVPAILCEELPAVGVVR